MYDLIIEEAIAYVKEKFKNDFSGHDYFHTMRVYRLATYLAIKEEAQVDIVQLAALLHDVDDIKLSPQTYTHKDNAVYFLKTHHVNERVIEKICGIIEKISFSGDGSNRPETLEGCCVQDADRLDALGAIGIARAFAYGGSHNRIMYHPDIKPRLNMTKEEYINYLSTTINHFYEKLFLLKDLMNTKTAYELAVEREDYMRIFIAEFMEEWNGPQHENE